MKRRMMKRLIANEDAAKAAREKRADARRFTGAPCTAFAELDCENSLESPEAGLLSNLPHDDDDSSGSGAQQA